MKYYALKDENKKIIVNTWDEAQELLKDMIKPKYKSFSTIEGAQNFLDDIVIKNVADAPTAYIDGSYDLNTKNYSFGGVLIVDGIEYLFKKKYDNDEYSDLRNIAGEIKGAGYIINYCVNHNINTINIYYDYIGIEKWYNKEWKANSSIAIEYVKFADSIRDKINVVFHKVKSHSNDYYNDLADKLAKEALGI